MTQSVRCTPFALAIALLTACTYESTSPSVTQVQVTPATLTIATGQSSQLTAAINTAPPSSGYRMSWTSADSTSASVDSTGLVLGKTASPGVAICATAIATGMTSGMKGCATVTVSPSMLCPGPAGSLIPANDTLHIGDIAQFQIPAAQLAGRNANEVRWTADVPATATVDSMTGLVTAKGIGGTNIFANDPVATSPCPHQWHAIVIVH